MTRRATTANLPVTPATYQSSNYPSLSDLARYTGVTPRRWRIVEEGDIA